MEDAVQHYEQAARVRPEDYQALLLMQGPLHALGRHDAAKDALRRGLQIAERHLELNPDDARALYLGATALVQLGEVDRGLDWSARACAIDREDPGVLYSAACVYAIGRCPTRRSSALSGRWLTGSGTGSGSTMTPTLIRCEAIRGSKRCARRSDAVIAPHAGNPTTSAQDCFRGRLTVART